MELEKVLKALSLNSIGIRESDFKKITFSIPNVKIFYGEDDNYFDILFEWIIKI